MREAREFRVHFEEFQQLGITVAGITRESVESNRQWAERLGLPFPMLSDPDGQATHALGAVRRVPIGPWNLEIVRRITLLVDTQGRVAALWEKVKFRGHALEVLNAAKAGRDSTGPPGS